VRRERQVKRERQERREGQKVKERREVRKNSWQGKRKGDRREEIQREGRE